MVIHTIKMGVTRCYVLQDRGIIMIDSGPPGKVNLLLKYLRKTSIDPKEIKLIVHTHGHFDHVGSAKAVKEATGAQVAMHEPDKEWLEKGVSVLPSGVTKLARIGVRMLSALPIKIAAVPVDIVLPDTEFSLVPFGIPGKVLFTPGHSMGSVSVLLDSGDAFVGDLAMNGLPMRLGPGLPPLADSLEMVKKSWALLLEKGVKVVHPAHGNSFSVGVIRKAIG